LIGSSLVSLPEPDLTATHVNRLSRWRKVSHLLKQFWCRWSKDYLVQLQVRNKWEKNRGASIQIGTIVIMRDEHLPTLCWKIARVKEVHADNDGIIRVATVPTTNGDFKRAVRLLSPLPFEGN